MECVLYTRVSISSFVCFVHRIALVPLYNNYTDAHRFVALLEESVKEAIGTAFFISAPLSHRYLVFWDHRRVM
jgi:hypothetical protein